MYSSQFIINTTPDRSELYGALEALLYVPEESLRPPVIQEIVSYIESMQKDVAFATEAIIVRDSADYMGFVLASVHPEYRSYSRECATFGWLCFNHPSVVAVLMKQVESFARAHRMRKIRGTINFPKGLGGIGIQVHGFNQPPLYGVAFHDPQVDYLGPLKTLGYTYESEYTCLRVDAKTWEKAAEIHPNIEFRYASLQEIEQDILPEAKALGKAAFNQILPDTTSGDRRWKELFALHRQIPMERLQIPENFADISRRRHFIDAWESCELSEIDPFMPMAFDKTTGELVGFLLGIPNIYEKWRGGEIITANVDTALVHPNYGGQGIFSGLNNIGQLTCSFYGITAFEGTSVWSASAKGINNTQAINSIFPHCTPLRKHQVLEKRIKL